MRLHFTAVASALLALSHAHGQASFGTAPEPITGAMLERWFAELDLSQPQRQAVDQLHATYLQNFAEIREDEIEEVVSRGGIFGAIFGGGDVGKVFREIDQLIDEVEDVDEIFLDQIEPILTPNQMLILERLDARRDRVRRSGGPLSLLGRANPAGLADLSALIPLDRMADPELSTILNEYETELADRFERLERSAKNAFNTFAETLADLRESSDDRRAIFQEMQNVMADASLPVIREATSVSRLHRETLPQLEIALGQEAGDELRANWLDTCYSEVGREENRVRRRFLSALQLADLDGETKSLVKATWSDWREKLRSVAKPMLDAVDATRAEASLITFGRSRGRGGGIPDTLEDQQENIAERAIEELVMLIGESRYEKLNDRNKSADGRRRRDPRMQGPRTKSTAGCLKWQFLLRVQMDFWPAPSHSLLSWTAFLLCDPQLTKVFLAPSKLFTSRTNSTGMLKLRKNCKESLKQEQPSGNGTGRAASKDPPILKLESSRWPGVLSPRPKPDSTMICLNCSMQSLLSRQKSALA